MILNLSIENYKSIDKTSLNFREMNVLIGKNGAGKTTLISVLNLLRKLASGDNLNHAVNSIAPFGAEFFNLNSDNSTAKFSAEIQSSKQRFLFSFTVTFRGNHDNGKQSAFYISSESLHNLEQDGDRHLIYQRSGEEGKIEIPSGNGKTEPLPLNVEDDQLVLSKYSLDTVKVVASTLAAYTVIWLDMPPRVNRYELVNGNELDLSTIDGVAVDLFKNDPVSYEKAMAAIASIIPSFTPPEIVNIEKAIQRRSTVDGKVAADRKKIETFLVSWSDGDYSKSYGVSRISVSGGNSRVIFLILSLFNSKTSTCFVAEEIENGMHLSRVSKLIDQMRMIVKNRKIQLVFTTHNHLILDDLLPNEVIFTKMTKKGSTYERLTETREYQDVEKDLGRSPTSSEMVNSGLLFD